MLTRDLSPRLTHDSVAIGEAALATGWLRAGYGLARRAVALLTAVESAAG
jgi:hypothetical protein